MDKTISDSYSHTLSQDSRCFCWRSLIFWFWIYCEHFQILYDLYKWWISYSELKKLIFERNFSIFEKSIDVITFHRFHRDKIQLLGSIFPKWRRTSFYYFSIIDSICINYSKILFFPFLFLSMRFELFSFKSWFYFYNMISKKLQTTSRKYENLITLRLLDVLTPSFEKEFYLSSSSLLILHIFMYSFSFNRSFTHSLLNRYFQISEFQYWSCIPTIRILVWSELLFLRSLQIKFQQSPRTSDPTDAIRYLWHVGSKSDRLLWSSSVSTVSSVFWNWSSSPDSTSRAPESEKYPRLPESIRGICDVGCKSGRVLPSSWV